MGFCPGRCQRFRFLSRGATTFPFGLAGRCGENSFPPSGEKNPAGTWGKKDLENWAIGEDVIHRFKNWGGL